MATRAHDPRPKEVLAPNFDAEVDASSPDNERMAALYPEHVLSGCKTRLGPWAFREVAQDGELRLFGWGPKS